MEHNEIGTGGQESSTAYTLHGRPLAVGTRLSGPESWGKDRVYLVTELKMDHGPVAVVQAYPDPGVKYIIRLDHKSVYLWEVVLPKLNGEEIKAGDVLLGHNGELMDIGKIEWETTGGLSIHGQERGAPEGKTLYVGPGLSRPYWSKWVPKVAGEPIAVGDWVTYGTVKTVGRVEEIRPVPGTDRVSLFLDLRPGGKGCSTMTTGYSTLEGQDKCVPIRKLHPQDSLVRPVIGDLVKHPTRDAIGKITDIYGEYNRYVSVEWFGTQQGVHTHTDYHWNWARRAEKPLVLLRPTPEPIATQDELNEIEKVKREKEENLENAMGGYTKTSMDRLTRFYKDINLYSLLDPTPLKYVNWPSKRPEDVQLKKGDYVYHAERREFGQIDQLTESRDHTPIALVQTTGVVGKTAPIWYNTSELRRSANLHSGAIVLHPEEGSGVVTWVNRLDTGENLCVEFNKGVKVVYNANSDDVFALKRIGVTYIENSESHGYKCVADQACAPAVGAEVGAGTGGSLSKAELSAQTAWKPFPGYLPEKKGKYLVHFVEFGDCKVIRWKGTRWAKYNDSVSSFYTVPIEEIVPFVGAISAQALTEQQLNELDPPKFKVGDTVYDPVRYPGMTGTVEGIGPGWWGYPIRVKFGLDSAPSYTEDGKYTVDSQRTLSHLNYTPGYIIT